MNEDIIAQVVSKVLEQTSLKSEGYRLTPNINLDTALMLMGKVQEKAESMGMRVVTAVADAKGRPIAVHCMDDAYVGSYDIAVNKTYTAIAFQMSTEKLGTLSGPEGPLYGIQHSNEGKVIIFGGGIPLIVGEQIIGAFGVSGGSAQQDTELAHYAEDIFQEMIHRKDRV